ncbi:MAG TPA: ribulose-phosphate 3-epimerase [Clostridia bacterium]|nr:ribulose-phosphate 3-epimerase [Clostridia bacterium]
MTKFMVSPSILSGDFANMGESVKKACDWGADLIHVDVMDGVYVPNITFGMPMVSAIKPYSSVPLDVHLMITEPEKYVGSFVDSGADIVTFHPDASKDVRKGLDIIKSKGAKCGLVLNPDKPLDLVYPYLAEIDMVLLMSVFPGFGGQKFIESVLDKAKVLKEYIEKNNLNVDIEIDGGVSSKNAEKVRNSGVNILVAGSAVFKSENPTKEISLIKGE